MASARYRLLTPKEFEQIIRDGTATEVLRRYVQKKRGPQKGKSTPKSGVPRETTNGLKDGEHHNEPIDLSK